MTALLFLPAGSMLATALAVLIGLLVGSFLNVVVYRLPRMMQREDENCLAEMQGLPLPHTDRFDLVLPASRCPQCGHEITPLENIPVLSYLFLRGRCAGCKTPISIRYPLVELACAALSGLVVWRMGSGVAGLSGLLLTWFLLSMSLIDADTQLLPDSMTLPLLWCGLLLNLDGQIVPLRDAVIGAVVGYLALWSVYWGFKLWTGKEGMGYGDFKLLAALGAWMGWMALPLIILLSSAVGTVVGGALILAKRMQRSTPLPFGPYLAAAGFIAYLWGKPMLNWLLAGALQ